MLLHGQGLAFKGAAIPEVARIMTQAEARRGAGIGVTERVSEAQLLEAYTRMGLKPESWSPEVKARMLEPLTAREAEMHAAATAEIKRKQDAGQLPRVDEAGSVDKILLSRENPGDGTVNQSTGPTGTRSDARPVADITAADRDFFGRFAEETGSALSPTHRPETSPATAPAELIADWLGLKLKWFRGPRSYHAMMDVDTRTAWVNAERPDVTAPSLVLHEAWHQMGKSDPDLAAAVTDHFNRLAHEGHVDLPGFEKFLRVSGYKGDDVSIGEMMAHIAEEFAHDPKFWDKAFAKDPGLGARALASINKWIDKIAILLKLKEPTITSDVHGKFLKTVEAVDTMREHFANAYAGMAERARSGGPSAKEGMPQGPPGKISFALDMNPNKAVGMAASKVPVMAEVPPIAFAADVKEAARAVSLMMEEKTRAVVPARGGMTVNLANPDHQRAAWLGVDPTTARVAHVLNSSASGYRQPDPAKVRGAPLLRNTLVNADFVVHAKDHAGRESPTWINVYQDSSSPTGELWHFVVADKDGNFQTQYSAPSIAGTSAEAAVVKAAGQRAPRKK